MRAMEIYWWYGGQQHHSHRSHTIGRNKKITNNDSLSALRSIERQQNNMELESMQTKQFLTHGAMNCIEKKHLKNSFSHI